jgi:hypothetical protein
MSNLKYEYYQEYIKVQVRTSNNACLEAKGERILCMFKSRQQNERKKVPSKTCEVEIQYLRRTARNQSNNYEKNRLYLVNGCYHPVQNLLAFLPI